MSIKLGEKAYLLGYFSIIMQKKLGFHSVLIENIKEPGHNAREAQCS